MSELNDLALRENINLDECIVFVKDGRDNLAVNVDFVGIKQRQDKLMGVNFTMSPKQVKQLDEFFSDVHAGELLYYDISRTGFIPVNYRGLSNVTRKVSTDSDAIFEVTLLIEPAHNVPRDNYFAPTCACCSLHHIF